MLQWKATHPRMYGQHKLDLMDAKTKPNNKARVHSVGWVEEGDLRGVKGGDEYNQECINHLAEVHTDKAFF